MAELGPLAPPSRQSRPRFGITRDDFFQIVRYGLTGGFLTVLAAGVYLLATYQFGLAPLLANVVAYLVAMALGYVLHERFSFRGAPQTTSTAGRSAKFVLTSLISFALNSLFVWLLTGVLHGPDWWATVPMVFVTPAICFLIYRFWVFR